MSNRIAFVDPRREETLFESSTESFDRLAYAQEAVRLLAPKRTRVALCSGVRRLTVEVGRHWGDVEDARWALVAIPPTASRRAIALAVATLARPDDRPFALDLLFADAQ